MKAAGAPGTAAHGYRDVVHVPDEDCTEARRPTAVQARAIELLELNPHRTEFVRLSIAAWRVVDKVAAELGVPAPRVGGER